MRPQARSTNGLCHATFLFAVLAGGGGPCDRYLAPEPESRPPLELKADAMSESDIPNEPLQGTLGEEPFELRDARYFTVRMAGRERVDLYFAEEAIEQCNVPLARDSRRVWLRFPGTTQLTPGIYRVDEQSDDPPFSIHYEMREHAGWQGVTGGTALLVIQEKIEGRLLGRLRACFNDEGGSCVAGTFEARICTGALAVDDPVFGASGPGLPPVGDTSPEP